jgi:flavin-binding protein dodecin
VCVCVRLCVSVRECAEKRTDRGDGGYIYCYHPEARQGKLRHALYEELAADLHEGLAQQVLATATGAVGTGPPHIVHTRALLHGRGVRVDEDAKHALRGAELVAEDKEHSLVAQALPHPLGGRAQGHDVARAEALCLLRVEGEADGLVHVHSVLREGGLARGAVLLDDEELRKLKGVLARRVPPEDLDAEERGPRKIWVHEGRAKVGGAEIKDGIATDGNITRVKVAHLAIVLEVGVKMEDGAAAVAQRGHGRATAGSGHSVGPGVVACAVIGMALLGSLGRRRWERCRRSQREEVEQRVERQWRDGDAEGQARGPHEVVGRAAGWVHHARAVNNGVEWDKSVLGLIQNDDGERSIRAEEDVAKGANGGEARAGVHEPERLSHWELRDAPLVQCVRRGRRVHGVTGLVHGEESRQVRGRAGEGGAERGSRKVHERGRREIWRGDAASAGGLQGRWHGQIGESAIISRKFCEITCKFLGGVTGTGAITSERHARFFWLLLFRQGIEPHPGPTSFGPHLVSCKNAACVGSIIEYDSGSTPATSNAPGRTRYTCTRCTYKFTQCDPRKLMDEPGRDPERRWCPWGKGGPPPNHPLRTGLPPPDVLATPVGGGRDRDPPPPPPAGGKEAKLGDAMVEFHNANSIQMKVVFDTYAVRHVLSRGAMRGVCETYLSHLQATQYAVELEQNGDGRMYHAAASTRTTKNTGCALLIPPCVPKAHDEKVVYSRADGKALGVHMTWMGRKLLVLVTHAYAGAEDEMKEAFFESVLEELHEAYRRPEVDGVLGERECIWMSDDNYVDDRARDVVPAGEGKVHERAKDAAQDLARAVRAPVDVYRWANPAGTATTFGKEGERKRRLDKIRVSHSLLQGERSFVAATHLHPSTSRVLYTKAKGPGEWEMTEKESDHWVVQCTFRVSGIKAPERGFVFGTEILHEDRTRQEMGEWVRNVMQEQHATPSQKQQALEQAVRDASDGIRKREWGKLQGKVQAARGAVAHAQRQCREATTAVAVKEWQERTARAKREAAEATLRVQQAWRRRRAGKLAENEMDSAAVISKLLRGRKREEPVRMMRRTVDGVMREETSADGIHEAMRETWAPLFQMLSDDSEESRACMREVMDGIASDPRCRLGGWMREALSIEAVLSEENVRDAVRSLRAHTTPGKDGIPIDFYQVFLEEEGLLAHLCSLFREVYEKGEMPATMRESVVAMLYKNKGERADPSMYRPITLTAATYRILGRAMAQRLAFVLRRMVGDSQIAFQSSRHIRENIDLVTEIIRFCENDETEAGGLAFILDNSKAYDRVQWPFLQETLKAFGVADMP